MTCGFCFYIIYLNLLYMHWCEGIRCPGTGTTDSYELPCRGWELHPGPLEEQSEVLPTEPSLQL